MKVIHHKVSVQMGIARTSAFARAGVNGTQGGGPRCLRWRPQQLAKGVCGGLRRGSHGPDRPRNAPCYGTMAGCRPRGRLEHARRRRFRRRGGWPVRRCAEKFLVQIIMDTRYRRAGTFQSPRCVLLTRSRGLQLLRTHVHLTVVRSKLPKNFRLPILSWRWE